MFNKFETRSLFNQLRINDTYKIRYYSWRNGHNNEFPNILSIEEKINENNTQSNDWNKYFGAYSTKRDYNLESQQNMKIFEDDSN
ncbi:MAG: hypothetical protein BZ135_00945 [Methanosphaera sp. rholeuAM6]|nr:MAG: hypothetical protein BZ135_00945 [Methanosphaera sp. rholeuAM6]